MECVSEAGVKTVAVDEVDDGRKKFKNLCRCVIHELVNHVKQRRNKASECCRRVFCCLLAVICRFNNVRNIECFKNRNDTECITFRTVNYNLIGIAASVFVCNAVCVNKELILSVAEEPLNNAGNRSQNFNKSVFKGLSVAVFKAPVIVIGVLIPCVNVNFKKFLNEAGDNALRIILLKKRLEVCECAGDKLDNILAVEIAADELMHEVAEVENLLSVDRETKEINHVLNKDVKVIDKLESLFSCPKVTVANLSEDFGHCEGAENCSGVCILGEDPAEVLHLEFKLPEVHHVDDSLIVVFAEDF